MSTYRKIQGASLATAVALAFLATPALPAFASEGSQGLVICAGVNSCRGKSDCRVTTSSCKIISQKGTNACKGQGFLILSASECRKSGGQGLRLGDPPSLVHWKQ